MTHFPQVGNCRDAIEMYSARACESRRARSSDSRIDHVLECIEVAAQHFGRTLAPADSLRLIVAQINVVLPVSGAALYLVGRSCGKELAAAVQTDGDEAGGGAEWMPRVVDGAVSSEMVYRERTGRGEMVGVPLWRNDVVFGVLTVRTAAFCGAEHTHALFESIGERVTPFFLSSLSSERGRAMAMTDAITDLPNERAFYVTLEDQVAKSQQDIASKPLSVLAIDIKDLDEFNELHGAAACPRILSFVARGLRESLRETDLVALAGAGEFLAVLPGATRGMSQDIVARIHAEFGARRLQVADGHPVKIELNVGIASFGVDSQTGPQMLSLARALRDRRYPSAPAKILHFPVQESRV